MSRGRVHAPTLVVAASGVILAASIGVAYVGVVSAAIAPARVASVAPEGRSVTLAPCPTEDSSDCYWDATQHGNGQGRSFIDIAGVTYFAGAER